MQIDPNTPAAWCDAHLRAALSLEKFAPRGSSSLALRSALQLQVNEPMVTELVDSCRGACIWFDPVRNHFVFALHGVEATVVDDGSYEPWYTLGLPRSIRITMGIDPQGIAG